jgi:aliphatic nitrilase
MVDYTSTFRVAAVQAEPVWFDAARTVDKTVALISEAAGNGAQLIAFPEVWIPGYPYQIWVDSPMYGIANGYHTRYHQNSLTMDGPHVARLLQAAKDHEIAVVVGISEREGGSLYMTQLVIGSDGALIAKRRKLKPTHVERSVYGEGDGSDIAVYELPFARVGALNCWEHFQTLTKYAMFSQHEQLHVAGWPGMSLYQPHVHAFSAEAQVIATRMYAMEGQTFVACSTQVVTEAAQDFFCQTDEHRALIGYGGGFARIYGPGGEELATPLAADDEGVLYGDINLSMITIAKGAADPVGHYSRPDVFQLQFNQHANKVVNLVETEQPAPLNPAPPEPTEIDPVPAPRALESAAAVD